MSGNINHEESKGIIKGSPESALPAKGLFETILGEMKSVFNKTTISEVLKDEKYSEEAGEVSAVKRDIGEKIKTEILDDSGTENVGESSEHEIKVCDAKCQKVEVDKLRKDTSLRSSVPLKCPANDMPCIVITLNSNGEVVDNQHNLRKLKMESVTGDEEYEEDEEEDGDEEEEDDDCVSKTVKIEDCPQEGSLGAKRSLRSQKALQETPGASGVKRSARRHSKDSPRETVLQSAIARKEKSFSNLSHSEDKSCSRGNLKVPTHKSPRLSPVEKSPTTKVSSRAVVSGERGKIVTLPKSPRLLSQVGLQPTSSSKSDETAGKPPSKGKQSLEINGGLKVSDCIKQEPGSKLSLRSQIPPNAAPAYTKTGKRRYKPFKGLRYSFSGPAKRAKLGRRQCRERTWESSRNLSVAQGRKIPTRNSRIVVVKDNTGDTVRSTVKTVKAKTVSSKPEIPLPVSSSLEKKESGGGAGRSGSPVVAEACQTVSHKRKVQPSVEEELEEAGKRSRHSHMPSPSPVDDSQGPSKPESSAISSGAGTAALCCCQVKSQLFVTARSPGGGPGGDLYCQAVDSYDTRSIGCCSVIGLVDVRMYRPSVKVPYMILCELHLNRLLRHNCCPGCGIFCTQGRFVQCASSHLFHRECQLMVGDKPVCPHCGLDAPQNESILTFGVFTNPVFLPQQKPPKKFPPAKMTFVNASVCPEMTIELPDLVKPPVTLTLPSGRVISAEGLSSPLDKDKLTRFLSILGNIRNGTPDGVVPSGARFTPKALYHAAKSGNAEKLLAALAHGLNPNHQFRDIAMGTALHAASSGNHQMAVHILLQAGAQIDMMDREQNTALSLAALGGHTALIKYLVKAGACVTLKGTDGMTSLHLAAKGGNLEACHYLLSTPNVPRTFIDMVDEGGWTPLVWAAEHCHTEVARYLLSKKADPLIRDAEQNIALHWSAFSGSLDITEMLLNYGCEVNCTNLHGDTPLHIGARQNMHTCVLLLLARGADVNIKNNLGVTPQNCCLSATSDCFRVISLNLELQSITRRNKKGNLKLLSNDISRGKEISPIQCVNNEDNEGEPHDYVYISENCFTSNIQVNRTITSLQSCRCTDSCSNSSCLCGNISIRCWYDNDGRLMPDFNYADPPMLFECNQACACNCITCNNRVVQSGLSTRFQLFRTRGKGWGVRTLMPISKGTYVCEYIGEIISDCEADHREDDSYLFDLDNKDGETYCIDARHYGNVARFINHMCVPNLQPVRVFIDHQDLHFPRIAFFANRDIAAEEELGFDYGEKFWIIKCKSFTCTCGAETCRYSDLTISQTLENYRARLQEEAN